MSLLEGSGVEARGGRIIVNAQQATNLPGVFAGGEGSRGPASVIEAVADGAKAASGIDKHLGGDGEIYKPLLPEGEMNLKLPDIPKFATLTRVPARKKAPCERKADFSEVEHCFSAQEAKAEAERCLRCDLRLRIMPVTMPPEKWVELNAANVSKVPAKEGVYQLLDEKKGILTIKGSQNLLADIKAKVGSKTKAKYFGFDVDPMYSKRESELIQHYLQQFGKMPPGDGEGESMDDLF
jgi:hypothetical protein